MHNKFSLEWNALARRARKRSVTGIYHVMVRGINKELIFRKNKDRFYYLQVLSEVKKSAPFVLHAYCLMGNHVHLLLQELDEPVGDTLRRIGSSYVYWFNRSYERVGHLFQGRFLSEAIEDDPYFLTVLRYIHQNPVKAGITRYCHEYPWSSYAIYSGTAKKDSVLVDTAFSLDILGGRETLLKFINAANEDICLDIENATPLPDSEFLVVAGKLLGGAPIASLIKMNPKERDRILAQLKAMEGVTVRQIARLTGLGRWVVSNA